MTATKVAVAVGLLLATATLAAPQGRFKAVLSGYEEVPTLVTASSGEATVDVASDGASLTVTLTFTGLEAAAQSAGLYLGRPGVQGQRITYICGGTKTTCPTGPDGTVTATVMANDVTGVPGQGLAAGDFEALLRAIDNDAVYVNVRTLKYGDGEIRGQLDRGVGKPGNAGKPGNGRGRGHAGPE
jgi:hypothetical protein